METFLESNGVGDSAGLLADRDEPPAEPSDCWNGVLSPPEDVKEDLADLVCCIFSPALDDDNEPEPAYLAWDDCLSRSDNEENEDLVGLSVAGESTVMF